MTRVSGSEANSVWVQVDSDSEYRTHLDHLECKIVELAFQNITM